MPAIEYLANIINSGPNSGVIHNGDIVFLSANKIGITQTKAPTINKVDMVPSGTYSTTTYGPLGDRFRHPGTDVTTV